MTTQDKLKVIRSKCITSNPEIVLDCGVAHCQDGHLPLGENEDGSIEWGGCPVCVKNGSYNPPERTITLSDILLAIEKADLQMSIEIEQVCKGRLFLFYRMVDGEIIGEHWELQNNSLDWHAEHKPETIDFIYQLIK